MKKNYRIAPDVREQILKRIKEEGGLEILCIMAYLVNYGYIFAFVAIIDYNWL